MNHQAVHRAIFAGVLAVTLAALTACDEGEEPAPTASLPPPSVVVAEVVRRPVAGSVEFVGRTAAYEQVDLRARVQGFLQERPFTEGDTVEKGALLFVIDPSEYQAAVQAAKADIQQSRAQLEAAQNEVDRARELIQRGNISQSEVDRREAEANRLKAQIEAGKAALTQAELNLSYTKITSPVAGRTSRGAYDVGNLIGPDSGVLANVVRLDPIYVTFPVSEREYLDYMKAEERPEITPKLRLADGSAYGQEGKIDFIDNRIDPTTGTITVRTVFPNPDTLLLPGQFVTVTLSESEPEERLVVPQAAVQENQAGRFVLVVDDENRVQARQVTMGPRVGTEWVVADGLQEGEQVIIEGIQKVRPGGEVNATSGGRAAPAPAPGS